MPKHRIIHLETTNSTNIYLKKLSTTTKLEEGTVILADFQENGKGQGANEWFSDRGQNILASVLLYPKIPVADFFSLTTFFSLAVTEMLSQFGIEATIKWPNDIYFRSKKIAGILVENSILQTEISQSVIGFGLNVNQMDFPDTLPNPVSMREITGRKFDPEEVLSCLLNKIDKEYSILQGNNFQDLLGRYNARLFKRDKLCQLILQDGKTGRGIIREVEIQGELVVEDIKGKFSKFLFNEVKISVVP